MPIGSEILGFGIDRPMSHNISKKKSAYLNTPSIAILQMRPITNAVFLARPLNRSIPSPLK